MPKSILELFDKSETGKVLEIRPEDIRPSRYQPRTAFTKESIDELADSIQANGLITPITVRKSENGYELIAGERRYRACKQLGYETIPCYVLAPEEDQAAEMALVENIQREDLSSVEEAKCYRDIMERTGITQEMLAQRVGKSQSAIANKIRLLSLDEDVQQQVVQKELSERQARALLALPKSQQAHAAKVIREKGYTVRETETYIENLNHPKIKKRPQKTKGFTRNIQIAINTVNQCVGMIQKMGVDANSEITEKDSEVCITIHLPR